MRDGGRCQWEVASGGVCGSTRKIEFDHIVPIARRGASTVPNIRLLCEFHNQCAAREVFGDAWMDRFTSSASPDPTQASDHPSAQSRRDGS